MDGSENSLRALDLAVFLAKRCNAKIICLYSIVIIPITEASNGCANSISNRRGKIRKKDSRKSKESCQTKQY
ncbi:hypothetical protein [Candidatus Nitrosotenuis chungbukensis]|uniref:hypothetical protein n=1 Tax=Candidatus Nitrosotenuis chungbukensis TaxID=1353246 RepID=UPI003B967E8B